MSKSHELTTKNGGKFDFKDGGTYIGEWCDGRAHGFGIATGPNNQGEYSGDWSVGFENCGVYIWPSGNVYEGLWMKGKRHGEGIQIMGRWVYKGSFTTGFFGRYGVKSSLYTKSRYEGCWHLNEFDGYGIETCADGSTYAGMWFKNQRKGLGVSRSAQFGLANDFKDSRDCRPSMADLSSHYGECRESSTNVYRDCSVNEIRNGFVLCFHSNKYKSKSPDFTDLGNLFSIKKTSRKNTNSKVTDQPSTQTDQTKSFKLHKKLLMRLRKKINYPYERSCRSLSRQRNNDNNETDFLRNPPGSLKSTYSRDHNPTESTMPTSSGSSCCQGGNNSFSSVVPVEDILAAIPKHTIETYAGQWNANTRTGLGVAERSDGVKYIGEWQNNKRHGYGITCFSDNTREEGRYKDNVLCQQLNRKSRIFIVKHSRLKNLVDDFARKALEVAQDAKIKAVETACQRAQTALAAAISAEARAEDARKMSKRARETAKQIAPNFEQPGPIWELKRKKDEAASRSAIVLTKIQVHSPISSLSFDSASKKLENYYEHTTFQQKINQKSIKSPTKFRHYHAQFKTRSIANDNEFSSESDLQSTIYHHPSSEFGRRPNCRWLAENQESPYLDLIWASHKKCSPIDQSPPSIKLFDTTIKNEDIEISNSEKKKSKPKLKSFKTNQVTTSQEMPLISRSSHQDSGYYSMEPDSTQISHMNTSICMPLPILSFSDNQKQEMRCKFYSRISPIKSLNIDQYKINPMNKKKSSIRKLCRGSSMDESFLYSRQSKIDGTTFSRLNNVRSKFSDDTFKSDLKPSTTKVGLEKQEICAKITIFDKNKSNSESKLRMLNFSEETQFKFPEEKDEKENEFCLTRNQMRSSKRRIPALARSPPAFTHDDESENLFNKNYSMACSNKESLISFCSKLVSSNVIEPRQRSRIPISKFGSNKLFKNPKIPNKYSSSFSRSQNTYPKSIPLKTEKKEIPTDLTIYDLFSVILSAWTQYWMLKFRFSVMSSLVATIKIWVEENLSICIVLIINIILVLIFSHILLTKVNKEE